MSSVATTRWTDGSMRARAAPALCRRAALPLFGLAAVGLSVGFLAFLLVTMAWKGLGGFTRAETKLTIDFPRSDLILDPAALRGPQAEEAVGSARISTACWRRPRSRIYGEGAEELFGDAAARALGEQLIDDPDLLTQQGRAVAAGRQSKADVAVKSEGDPAIEKLVARSRRRHAARVFNGDFLTASDATDPSAVGIWGALKGSFLTIIGDDGAGLPDRRLPPSIWRNSRRGTAGPTSSKCRSTISPRCRRSSSACSASRSS